MTGTNLQGTNIISMIVPTNHADTYATHDSFYGKGGWREVNTLAERNEIPEERRRIGMVVYVRETFKAYLLKNSLSNAGWVPFNIDGEEYVTKEEFAEAMAEALENYPTKTEVQELLVSGGYATQSWVSEYIDGRLTNYQRKTDNTLQTENKTIVGAINELNAKPHIDTYSKEAEDALLALKANKDDTYSKEEEDALLALKANKDDTYTKLATDTLLEGKIAHLTELPSSNDYIDKIVQYVGETNLNYTNGFFYKYALAENGSYAWKQVDVQPGGANGYTREEVDALLETKANVADVPTVEDYEERCAQYEADIAALQERVGEMQTKLDYVYNIVTTPHYDILPDEEGA